MTDENHISLDQVRTLDTSGLKCPLPIMKTKWELSKLTAGDRLLVITTDPSFKVDFSVFLRQSGHILLHSWLEAEKFYYMIQHKQ
jgi:tRNA 2-thiouridine synthesizing protein A